MSIAIVAAAVLVGAALQSATGFGFALVTAPALFAVFEPGEALTTFALLSILLSVLVLATERRRPEILSRQVGGLVGWALPGLGIGVVLLGVIAKPILQVAVGAAVLAATVADLRAVANARGARGAAPRTWPIGPVGLVAGVLTTTTGVNGPPMLMYFQRSGASPHEVRDSLAASFGLLSLLSVGALLVAGRLGFGGGGVIELLLLVALVAVGRSAGRWAFLRLAPEHFRAAGVGLAALAGAASVVAGLLA